MTIAASLIGSPPQLAAVSRLTRAAQLPKASECRMVGRMAGRMDDAGWLAQERIFAAAGSVGDIARPITGTRKCWQLWLPSVVHVQTPAQLQAVEATPGRDFRAASTSAYAREARGAAALSHAWK